jgi:hypothetical protein
VRWSILLAAALLTSACVASPEAAATRRFMCADGAAFFARYRPGEVMLDFGGGVARILPADPQAGTWAYGAGGEAFRLKEDGDATLTLAGRPPVACIRSDIRNLAVIR